jgi:hypothetical protein
MLCRLPNPHPSLRNLVPTRRRWRHIHQMANPSMPAGLDLTRIDLMVLVVDPSCTQGELLGGVLEEAVAVAVGAD